MKKILFIGSLILMIISTHTKSFGQSAEATQLLLNVEKLSQLKQILSDLKKGYQIVYKGYSTIKDISSGNFSLHKTFLDGLLEVSPAVKKYRRVSDIINGQILLAKEYKAAYKRFGSSGNFSASELSYIGGVYERLLDGSLKNIEDLLNVVTAKKMRMSDDERIAAIDQLYQQMEDRLSFLRTFNNSTYILALQRTKAQKDIGTMKTMHGVNN